VRDSGTTRENVRAGAGARDRSSGAGNAGVRSGGRDGQDSQPATSGRSGGGGGASQNSGDRQRGRQPLARLWSHQARASAGSRRASLRTCSLCR
jgi:hypothetical protein